MYSGRYSALSISKAKTWRCASPPSTSKKLPYQLMKYLYPSTTNFVIIFQENCIKKIKVLMVNKMREQHHKHYSWSHPTSCTKCTPFPAKDDHCATFLHKAYFYFHIY